MQDMNASAKKHVTDKLSEFLVRRTEINDFEQSLIDGLINFYTFPTINIENLAGYIGINERTLRASSITLFGKPPKSLLTFIRLLHANFLLTNNIDMLFVATNSGFKSVKQLQRQLKNETK